MKILHVNDHYAHVGGVETVLFSSLDALEEQGATNVVVHQYPGEAGTGRRRVYRIPELGDAANWQESAAVLHGILREEKPDLIHLYDIDNPEVAVISRCYAPTLQSVYNHNLYCPGGGKFLPLWGRICERPFGVGCLASAFLTHCNSVRPRQLLFSYLRCHDRISHPRGLWFLALTQYQVKLLLQNGFPPQAVKALHPFTELPALPARADSSGSQTVLFTGRIVPQKGLSALLRSLTRVTAPFRLLVDGDGHDLENGRALAKSLGLDTKVEFVGWAAREKHLDYYRQAAVVVVPSLWPEPFGMVGIEAMSYAKPVVAFKVGGIPEWLEDGVTGFLIEPYDLGEMARRIEQLLQQPDLAREMGMRGRRRVEQEFTKERYVSRLLQIYDEAMAGGYVSEAAAAGQGIAAGAAGLEQPA